MTKMHKGRSPVHFISAISPRVGALAIAAYPDSLNGTDREFTRFFTYVDGRWLHQDYDLDIVGVTFEKSLKGNSWWLTGKRGSIIRVDPKSQEEFVLPAAGTGRRKLGYLSFIANVAGQLFVCGLSGQMYRFDGTQWVPVSGSVGDERFNVLTGVESTAIYLAGDNGQISFYNGSELSTLASPTNVHLYAATIVTPAEVYLAGKSGVVLVGTGDSFRPVFNDATEDTFWALQAFGGTVYGATSRGIFRINKAGVSPVGISTANHKPYRLSANASELWSVGERTILMTTDGQIWREIVHPDNA